MPVFTMNALDTLNTNCKTRSRNAGNVFRCYWYKNFPI